MTYNPFNPSKALTFDRVIEQDRRNYGHYAGGGIQTTAMVIDENYVIVHTRDSYKMHLQFDLGLGLYDTLRTNQYKTKYRFVARRYATLSDLKLSRLDSIYVQYEHECKIIGDVRFYVGTKYGNVFGREHNTALMNELINSGVDSIVPACETFLRWQNSARRYNGYPVIDLHTGNYAILPSGRPVFVDPFVI